MNDITQKEEERKRTVKKTIQESNVTEQKKKEMKI